MGAGLPGPDRSPAAAGRPPRCPVRLLTPVSPAELGSRERLLVALDGGEPDRVPRALSFYRVEIESIAPPGARVDDPVDVASARSTTSGRSRSRTCGRHTSSRAELFEAAWRLRGLEAFLTDLVERPEWAHCLLDRLAALARRNAEALPQDSAGPATPDCSARPIP